jgi:hypothetical protein
MRIVAFISEAPAVREILTYLGEPTSPPRMAPARGPPLWEIADAGQGQFDPNARPAPDYEFDSRASPGSPTRIRSRSSGSARAMGHRDGLSGRPGDP